MLNTETKIALAALAQRPVIGLRRMMGMSPVLQARRAGIEWMLDLREGIDFSIWLLGAFERRTVMAYSKVVKPGAVVFDIGANIGAHALVLANRVGDHGRVFAFEPVRWALDKLRANLQLNPRLGLRVETCQLLLSEREDDAVPAQMHASWPLNGFESVHPTLRARPLPTEGAVATTLDSFVSARGIAQLDFVKLDVDGYECRVLRGARQTLQRFRPTMVVELSPWALEEAGESFNDLLDVLDAVPYRLTELLSGAPLSADRNALRRMIPNRGGINVLALPHD